MVNLVRGSFILCVRPNFTICGKLMGNSIDTSIRESHEVSCIVIENRLVIIMQLQLAVTIVCDDIVLRTFCFPGQEMLIGDGMLCSKYLNLSTLRAKGVGLELMVENLHRWWMGSFL